MHVQYCMSWMHIAEFSRTPRCQTPAGKTIHPHPIIIILMHVRCNGLNDLINWALREIGFVGMLLS